MGNILSNEGGKPPDDDIESNGRDFENPQNISHEQNQVYEAIQNGNLKELEKLKDMLSRLPFDGERGTPLMYAISCFKNKTALNSLTIEKLLNLGCDVNEKSKGTYPLHEVCSIKYSTEEEGKQVLQLLEILSNTNKLEEKEIDDNDNSALHHAAYGGNKAAFLFLLKTKKGTDDSNVLEWVKTKNKENETALQIAAKHGYVKIMEILYQTLRLSEHDWEELLDAIKYNKIKEIETKLEEKNDQKVGIRAKIIQKFTKGKEKEGYDEINLLENNASCVEVIKLVKSLNNHDLIFKLRDINKNTTLHLAAERKSTNVYQEIISDSVNIPASYIGHKNQNEELAIDIAIRNVNKKMFKMMTERFVEFDQEDIFVQALEKFGIGLMSEVFGKLLFHYAAKKGWLTFLTKLIEKCDDDSKNYMKRGDENGKTAVHHAAEKGHDELLKKLIKISKDLRLKKDSKEGKLPIHLAVEKSNLRCIEILLDTKDYLKQLRAEDKDENSPFNYSNPRTFKTLVNKLKKEGRAKDFFDSRKANIEKLMESAAVNDNAELVKLLIEIGVSISNGVALFKAIDVKATKVIEIILDDPEGKEALMNVRGDKENPTTPFRELIKNCPNLALKVLEDIESSLKDDKYNVECIEDSSAFVWDEKEEEYHKGKPEENNRDFNGDNHPLMVMVKHKRMKLLAHPVITALIRSKWENSYWYYWYIKSIGYILFLSSVTNYGLKHLNRKDVTDINQLNDIDSSYIHQLFDNWSEDNVQFITFERIQIEILFVILSSAFCLAIDTHEAFYYIKKIGICRYLKHIEKIGAIVLYVLAIVITLNVKPFDFEDISKTSLCTTSECWKWPVWSLLLTASWINLIKYLKWFPFIEIGSYSVMIWEVTKPLLKIAPMFLLIFWSLAIGVNIILFQQDAFKTLAWTLLKLLTMSTGELDYGNIFFPDDRMENPITFPATTVVLYLLILILACVIMMNLAIGLAVNNIQEFQERADFKKIKDQVELLLFDQDNPNPKTTIPKASNFKHCCSSSIISYCIATLMEMVIFSGPLAKTNNAKYEKENRVGNTEILERLEELEIAIQRRTNKVQIEDHVHFQDISMDFEKISKEIKSQRQNNKTEIDEIRSQQLQILTTLNEMEKANRNNNFKHRTDDETTLISKHSIKDGSNEAITSLRDEIGDFKVEMKTLLRESMHLQRSTLLNQSDLLSFDNQNQATLSQNDIPIEDSILSPPKSEEAGNQEAITALKDEIRDFKVEMKTFLRESLSLQISALHQSSDDLKSVKSDSVIFTFDKENQADLSLVDFTGEARRNFNVAQSGVFNQHEDNFSMTSSDDCQSEYFPGEKL